MDSTSAEEASYTTITSHTLVVQVALLRIYHEAQLLNQDFVYSTEPYPPLVILLQLTSQKELCLFISMVSEPIKVKSSRFLQSMALYMSPSLL